MLQATNSHLQDSMKIKANLILACVAGFAMARSQEAAEYIAYDNTTGYESTVTSRGNIEIGDEINLIGGATTMTRFQFEYHSVGITTPATGIVRFYAMKAVTGTREQ